MESSLPLTQAAVPPAELTSYFQKTSDIFSSGTQTLVAEPEKSILDSGGIPEKSILDSGGIPEKSILDSDGIPEMSILDSVVMDQHVGQSVTIGIGDSDPRSEECSPFMLVDAPSTSNDSLEIEESATSYGSLQVTGVLPSNGKTT